MAKAIAFIELKDTETLENKIRAFVGGDSNR